MIDVSNYGGEPEPEFSLPPAPRPLPKKPTIPAPSVNWRGDPVVPLLRRVGVRSGKPRFPWLLTTGAFLLALPGTAIGIVLCLTIVGIPVGLPLMAVSCYPLRKVLDHHSKTLDCWYNRDRPLDEDTVKPWEQ